MTTAHNQPVTRTTLSRWLGAAAALCAGVGFGLIAGSASASDYNNNAESTRPNPWVEELQQDVGVAERLNSALPMDLAFTDENGKTVTLGEYFHGDRPVILNIGYYRCPVVCGLVVKKFADTVSETGLDMGDDFVVLSITIDPDESTEHALEARDTAHDFLKDNGISPDDDGWHFLTADKETIKQITTAVGYQYFYIKPQNEYGHPAVLVLATPDGRVGRYIHGTNYDARTLRLSLVETSDGEIGSFLDQAFLTCFRYDSEANNYTATARFIMMLGGGVTMVALAGGVGMMFMYERRRRHLLETDDINAGQSDF